MNRSVRQLKPYLVIFNRLKCEFYFPFRDSPFLGQVTIQVSKKFQNIISNLKFRKIQKILFMLVIRASRLGLENENRTKSLNGAFLLSMALKELNITNSQTSHLAICVECPRWRLFGMFARTSG